MNIPADSTPLLTGDILLVTGVHSHALVKAQRLIIPSAVSSHVVIAHGETICVDAVPTYGVRNQFVLDVFKNVEPGWRAIRERGLAEEDYENITKAAAFYLAQSYRPLSG